MAVPIAIVKLADLLRQRGERPLNVALRPGAVVKIVLSDTSGDMQKNSQNLKVSLELS
jgi:hypothetical protein